MVDSGEIAYGDPAEFEFTSDGYAAGSPNGPLELSYPDTEDWQKAIGAHNAWSTTTVKFEVDRDGMLKANAEVTLHAEDRFNFNPGMKDIATGQPDSDNGVLEEAGLAHQYMNRGEVTRKVEWDIGEVPNLEIEPTPSGEGSRRG